MTQANENIKEQITDYFIATYKNDLLNILRSPDPTASYAVLIDLLELVSEVPELTLKFFIESGTYLNLFQVCIFDAQKILFDNYIDEETKISIKNKITVRLHSLPCAKNVEIQLPRCKHVNRFVSFNGTVTKAYEKRCTEVKQKYTCIKCGHLFDVEIDFSHADLFVKPNKCLNEDCKSDRFNQVVEVGNSNKAELKDYQELKVQEKLDIMSIGTVPKSVIVIVEDDLVDICKPGDDITINGLVIQKWNRNEVNMRCDLELIIHANYIKINNEQQSQYTITNEKKIEFKKYWENFKEEPLRGRNNILKSICPKLYGMFVVRLAVSLVLTGGVSRRDQSTGTRIRGESHLLLVGDPGTGKSQILKFASKILPRGINTTGMGSTSAGLTATASRDGGQWHLEPGALVLADGGICCIDEFNCMKNDDKNSMLEAMEQQTISVAKAGIVCNLKTQCSVLAACNPKGKYDNTQPLTINLGLPSPLLSRFDVVLLLLDTPNETWDYAAAMFLLQGVDLLKEKRRYENQDEVEIISSTNDDKDKVWKFQDLRIYINYVKTLEPVITSNANAVIQRYYLMQRNMPDKNKARTTARMLESVIRLSQAHAKLMYRKEVQVMDAIVAISLMEASLDQSSSFESINILHTSFSDTPELEYRHQVEMILTRLNLGHILKDELVIIDNKFKDVYNTIDVSRICEEIQTQTQVKEVEIVRPQATNNLNQMTSMASKRKFMEELLSETNSGDNASKKTKTATSNELTNSQIINLSRTQLASSTQKPTQTQSRSIVNNLDDLNDDDLELDF